MSTETVVLGEADRIAELEDQLEAVMRRAEVLVWIAPHIHEYVDDDVELIDLVVDDIIDCWRNRAPDDTRPRELGGPLGFWSAYTQMVEWDTETEPGYECYREEFCPPAGKRFNTDTYFARAWAAHIARLSAAR